MANERSGRDGGWLDYWIKEIEHESERGKKMSESRRTHERIVFRLFQMPCCGHMLCWVNPRFPTYCPECGESVFQKIKACVMAKDEEATLTTELKYV